MIYLKEANKKDILKEYEAIIKIPENENGLENNFFNCSFEEFKDNVINKFIDYSQGKDLPNGYVPCTYFFLWDDDKIVGQFKIRHELNDVLRNGSGHIGYCVLSEYRGKGYATEGLKLAIEECKKIIKEDEIYLSVRKYNTPSLKVMLNNGAKIVNENEDHYFTRIKIR